MRKRGSKVARPSMLIGELAWVSKQKRHWCGENTKTKSSICKLFLVYWTWLVHKKGQLLARVMVRTGCWWSWSERSDKMQIIRTQPVCDRSGPPVPCGNLWMDLIFDVTNHLLQKRFWEKDTHGLGRGSRTLWCDEGASVVEVYQALKSTRSMIQIVGCNFYSVFVTVADCRFALRVFALWGKGSLKKRSSNLGLRGSIRSIVLESKIPASCHHGLVAEVRHTSSFPASEFCLEGNGHYCVIG